MGERELVAVLKRPDSAAIIWKQLCSKAEGEYVAEIVLTYQGGGFLVDHAMVFKKKMKNSSLYHQLNGYLNSCF